MKILIAPTLLLLSSLAIAANQNQEVLPMPIEPNLSNHKPLVANEVPIPEDTAKSEGERQYIHNINREAIIQNWKVQFGWNEDGYIGKYQHVNGDRGMFLKFEKEIKGSETALDTLKIYMDRYKCDKNTLKIYSDTLASAETLIAKDKPKDPTNVMRIYISKEKAGDGYTAIFVMGAVSDTDFKMVTEDFFLNISKKIHGQMKEIGSNPEISESKKEQQKDIKDPKNDKK